jgi:hypothetical protein
LTALSFEVLRVAAEVLRDQHGSPWINGNTVSKNGGISQNDWLISWKIPNNIFKMDEN